MASTVQGGGRERIIGYDLARALALLGMILVHFALVMSAQNPHPRWLAGVPVFLDGRAAALFVVLAGIGISLRCRGSGSEGGRMRGTLIRRGLFLLAVGFGNLVIWPGDILRVYGISFLVAASLIAVSDRMLAAVGSAFVLGFVVLLLTADYESHWDWETMSYHDLWTPEGVVRNLFYDGFRSVFPWTGLLVFGMWLGRRPLEQARLRHRFLLAGLVLLVVSESVSRALVAYFDRHPIGMDHETIVALFGTQSMPPLPFFLASSIGASLVAISLSLMVAERFPAARVVRALVATGQMAFTWYVGHIVLGLGTLVALDALEVYPLSASLGCGLAFFAAAVLISLFWRTRFRFGPLEWLMRKVAG